MRLAPVFSHADINDQGDIQTDHPFHSLFEDLFRLFHLVFRGLEDQLIVDLEDHEALHLLLDQGLLYPDHGRLDDIGGAPLDRGVDGGPFSVGRNIFIAVQKFRDGTPPVHDRGHITLFTGLP